MNLLYNLVFICFIIAVAVCLVWGLYDKFIGSKLAMLKLDAINARQLRSFIGKALDQLSCIPTWEKHDNRDICSYDYQGAHFRASISDGIPFVHLALYYIGSVPLEDINILRTVCNDFAFSAIPTKATYTIDQKEHRADIHIISNMMINKVNAKELLTNTMADMFNMQRDLKAKLQTEAEKAHKAECADIEVASAEWSGELDLLHELEISKQSNPFNKHEAIDEPIITPGELLSRIFGLTRCRFATMTAWCGNESIPSPTTADDIYNYPLYSLIVNNGQIIHDQATAELSFSTDDSDTGNRSACIHLSVERATRSVLYYRVTTTLMPQPANSTTSAFTTEVAKCQSIVAGYDRISVKKQLEAVAYQWREIRADANLQQSTATQRLLAACENPDMANLIYIGHQRYLDHRYFEAIPSLTAVHNYYSTKFDSLANDEKRNYYEVCYLLGSCYYHLQLFKEAHFYLFHTLPLNNIIYNEQYVNCIVSMGDTDAMRFIDTALDTLRQRMAMGRMNVNFLNFYYFLQRRKAEYLLNTNRTDEAEAWLRTMLDGNPNSDFAIQKLADIQKTKQ